MIIRDKSQLGLALTPKMKGDILYQIAVLNRKADSLIHLLNQTIEVERTAIEAIKKFTEHPSVGKPQQVGLIRGLGRWLKRTFW